jgi:hypothetical protein
MAAGAGTLSCAYRPYERQGTGPSLKQRSDDLKPGNK